MERALWDPLDPTRLGSLDPRLQYRVNGEVYRFSSEQTRWQFVKTPLRWCGVLRDPVTGRRFMPSARSPRAEWGGSPYFFESDSTRAQFVAHPRDYEVVRAA